MGMVQDYEPEATVWKAVAELEQQFFTRQEIAEALEGAADDLRVN